MNTFKKCLSPILLISAAMIWGFAFSAQKSAESVPPLTLGAVRSIFAAIFLVFVIFAFDAASGSGRRLFSRKKKIDLTRVEIIGGIICGLVLALASFFQQLGINCGTEPGKASFITSLYVVLVPVYALALRKNAPVNVWLSLPFAAVGFYLLCVTSGFSIVFSDFYVLLSALIFPIHILAIDKFSPACDGIRMSLVQFTTAAVMNTLLALIFESPVAFSEIGNAILPLLFLGVASSGIAYTLQIIGQRNANPAAASILLSLESVFGVIGASLFHSERMSLREYIGCAAVFFAVILSEIKFKKNKTQDK